jgi:hypothetical protein
MAVPQDMGAEEINPYRQAGKTLQYGAQSGQIGGLI